MYWSFISKWITLKVWHRINKKCQICRKKCVECTVCCKKSVKFTARISKLIKLSVFVALKRNWIMRKKERYDKCFEIVYTKVSANLYKNYNTGLSFLLLNARINYHIFDNFILAERFVGIWIIIISNTFVYNYYYLRITTLTFLPFIRHVNLFIDFYVILVCLSCIQTHRSSKQQMVKKFPKCNKPTLPSTYGFCVTLLWNDYTL